MCLFKGHSIFVSVFVTCSKTEQYKVFGPMFTCGLFNSTFFLSLQMSIAKEKLCLHGICPGLF